MLTRTAVGVAPNADTTPYRRFFEYQPNGGRCPPYALQMRVAAPPLVLSHAPMEHLEGRISVLAALQAHHRRFQAILIRHGMHAEKLQDVLQAAEARGVPIRYADNAELDALAHGTTHGGVIAICSAKPRTTTAELLDLLDTLDRQREPPLLVLLEGVDDARNLGFTLRSADALGVHAVLIKKHLWDFDTVEVARPASGAYERLPLVQIDDIEPLVAIRKRGVLLYGCIAAAKRTMYERNLAQGVLLAIGGEKRGLSGAVRSICDGFLTIPSKPGASSLSLSHAASIVMAEAMRQRLEQSQTAPRMRGTGAAEPNAERERAG
ncbi:MAG: TrmH family RNA methyltransferase [Phycisphaerae bacterium]